jgi:hypothetical protein
MLPDTESPHSIEGLAQIDVSTIKGEPGTGFEKRARKAPLRVTVVKVNSRE